MFKLNVYNNVTRRNIGNKGFTLVELLIAVSILVIITAATIPNFNTFITSQNLLQAREEVKNGIRDAQNRAITGVDSNSTYTWWGIKFVNNGSTNATYQIGKTTCTQASCPNGPGVTECTTLSTIDVISSVLPGDATFAITTSPSCIFYKMVSGDVSMVNLNSGSKVRLVVGANCKDVQVNSSGMVKGAVAVCS